MNIKKLQNWYDQIYYRITHLSIKRFWNNIERWFSYYKILRKCYDFDYGSNLLIEKHQLTRLKNTLLKSKVKYEGEERDIERINLAINLLNIIEEDGCSTLVKDNSFHDKDGVLHIDHEWKLTKYINVSNIRRFMNKHAEEGLLNPKQELFIKDCLRLEKAWQLYHKLRTYYMRHWWV